MARSGASYEELAELLGTDFVNPAPRTLVIEAAPGAALARLARLRPLRAGQVGGVDLGALDLTLAAGDSLLLDLKTADGASLFGALDLDIAPPDLP